jgi:perosamine synthetase
VDSGWISSVGSYVPRFENAVAAMTGSAHAIAVCNGTAALHLALHCLGIGTGDEVIVPSFTYIAPVNAIQQTGATPVFADCRSTDWLIDPMDVVRCITTRSKAILVPHLYGGAADMPALLALAAKHGLIVIEDCAEAIGTRLAGRHVGRFGAVGTFSFFGNKTVTTGEGGMVICDDPVLATRLRQLRSHAQSANRRYWHEERGFNYRMTNICAAIGLAQMERIDSIIDRKQQIAARYRTLLSGLDIVFAQPGSEVASSEWLVTILLPDGIDRPKLVARMLACGVETRPVFGCVHQMPMYRTGATLPTSETISRRGLSLPSYPGLSDDELSRVARCLAMACSEQSR